MKLRTLTFNAVAAALLFTPAGPVQAQGGDNCEQLWQQRNAIYFRFGYCFRTQRAIATFGRGCVPPYGRLPPDAAREVARIQAQEARLGCPT